MEHIFRQRKNCPNGDRQSEDSTLKIKNITFNRQYTKVVDKELLKFHMRMGRNVNHRGFSPHRKLKKEHKKIANENQYGAEVKAQHPKKVEQTLVLMGRKDRENAPGGDCFQEMSSVSSMFSIKAVNLNNLSNSTGTKLLPNYSDSQYMKPYLLNQANYRSQSQSKARSESQILNSKKAATLVLTKSKRDSELMGKGELAVRKCRAQTEKQFFSKPDNGKKQSLHSKNRKLLISSANITTQADRIFIRRLSDYCQFLEEQSSKYQMTVNFVKEYQSENQPSFCIGKGNNARVIKEALKKRWWWKKYEEEKASQLMFQHIGKICLIWTQNKLESYFEAEKSSSNTMHNHLQNNNCLGNKKELFANIKLFHETAQRDPFSSIPLTFHVRNSKEPEFEAFVEQFKRHEEGTADGSSKPRLWILKPGENSNRGRGITVHRNLEDIKAMIDRYSQEDQQSQKVGNLIEQVVEPPPSQNASQPSLKEGSALKRSMSHDSHTHIIQKYLDCPFLYQKRKFDIRCFYLLVNLNGTLKGYWYRDGYLRTSCFEYSTCIDSNSTKAEGDQQKSLFVHLTNDAIQKNCQQYGKYEEANKLDFPTFKKYLASLKSNKNRSFDFDKMVYEKMREIALNSIQATYLKLSSERAKQLPCFEIFGLDFMIDDNFKPWLIEVNTNPCLETSCALLERIIPKLIDDAFRLSVDLKFPPPLNWPYSKYHLIPSNVLNGFELIFEEPLLPS